VIVVKPESEEIRRVKCRGDDSITSLSVGEEFRYKFHRHGSVGEDATFEIGNTRIISHERTETVYLHPEKMKPGMTGGDAERGMWFFKAIAPGATTLTIFVMFRGEVESRCVVKLEVE